MSCEKSHEGLEQLGYEVKSALGHLWTGKLYLSTQLWMGTCFQKGKDMAMKGERWASPNSPLAFKLRETFAFTYNCVYNAFYSMMDREVSEIAKLQTDRD